MVDVTLLGTGGTMPLKNRRLSSAYLRLNGKGLLLDCGEGTQVSLRECGYTFKSCGIMCFTHFHADHISGLPGFLLSMGNEGRSEPLHIVGPAGLRLVVGSLRIIAPELPFEICFHELEQPQEQLLLDGYHITAFHVRHNINCYGYRFDIPRAGKFDPQKAIDNNVPMKLWSVLQKNKCAVMDGINYTCDMVLGEPRRGISLVYCTDTRPCKSLEQNAKGCDLMICEGMYGEDEKLERAQKSMHMTFSEACATARCAGVQRLWLTHFSPSLADPESYAECARSAFEFAQVGYDGMSDTLKFAD